MFGKNERIVDLLEAWTFEHDDPFESEGHNDKAAWDWKDDEVVVRDRDPFESEGCKDEAAWDWEDDEVVVRDWDNEDQTGGHGQSNSDMGIVVEAAYMFGLLMTWWSKVFSLSPKGSP